MCLSPIQIPLRKSDNPYDFYYTCECQTQSYKNIRFSLSRSPQSHYSIVKCGKCADCIKQRRNGYVTRFCKEFEQIGSLFFLTLTYSDENAPIAKSLAIVDRETGVMETYYYPEIVKAKHCPSYILDALIKLPKTKEGSYLEYPIKDFCENDPFFDYYARWSYSLCSKDVQKCLHQFRKQFEKTEGYKPEFSYFCVGEFGSHTSRPHYHIAIMPKNFDKKWIYWIYSYWTKRFGYAWYEHVNPVNKDGSNAASLVARYLSKYLVKGSAESRLIKDNIVPPSRVMASRSFGSFLSDDIKAFHLGFDAVGKYDPDTLLKPSGESLSDKELSIAIQCVRERQYFNIAIGKKADGETIFLKSPLPQSYKMKVYGYSISNPNLKKQAVPGKKNPAFIHRWFKIFRLAQATSSQFAVLDRFRKLTKAGFNGSSETLSEAVFKVEAAKQARAKTVQKAFEEDNLAFYSKDLDEFFYGV